MCHQHFPAPRTQQAEPGDSSQAARRAQKKARCAHSPGNWDPLTWLGSRDLPTLLILLQFSRSTKLVFLATLQTASSSGPCRVPVPTSRRDMLML